MARITTPQLPRTDRLVDTRYDVCVGGVKVGNLFKNKHGMWCGDFDLEATCNSIAYLQPGHVASRLSHSVAPSRRKSEVVAAIVRGEVGVYEAYLHSLSALYPATA